jgi:hypothetical protein
MKTITFSGFQWNVKPTGLAPPPPPPPRGRGPNMWDDGNAQVDDKGHLHLKITAGDPKWHCVELTTRQRLGFGRYQFQVIGRIDKFDPNVVLGLFNYPTPDVGQDGTNEIDIEFAQFRPPLNADYVVLPEIGPDIHKDTDRILFKFTLNGDYTTHRFLWQPERVTFQSLHGHRDDDNHEFQRWLYMPTPSTGLIPQKPLQVHINLWLKDAIPPSDGAEVEIVVSQFTFVPLA